MKSVLFILLILVSSYSEDTISLNVSLRVKDNLIIDNGSDTVSVASFDGGETWYRLSERGSFDTLMSGAIMDSLDFYYLGYVPVSVGYATEYTIKGSRAAIYEELYRSDIILNMAKETYNDSDTVVIPIGY
jgi:hypothetical protein